MVENLRPDSMVTAELVEELRGEHEPDEHWKLRYEFLLTHHENFPYFKLLSLAQLYCNIEVLGCSYPNDTMQMVAELAKGIGEARKLRQSGQIKRHMVDASAAAEQKIRGRNKTNNLPNNTAAAPVEISGSNSQAKIVYGPPVTKGPRITFGPPVSGTSEDNSTEMSSEASEQDIAKKSLKRKRIREANDKVEFA